MTTAAPATSRRVRRSAWRPAWRLLPLTGGARPAYWLPTACEPYVCVRALMGAVGMTHWRGAQRVARRLAALEQLPVQDGIDWRGLPTLLLPLRATPRMLAVLGIWLAVQHPVRALRCRRIAEHWTGDVRDVFRQAVGDAKETQKKRPPAHANDAAAPAIASGAENVPEALKKPRRAYGSITAEVAEDMGERAAMLRALGATWHAIGRELGCTKGMAWKLAHGQYRPAQQRRAA